MFFIYVRFSCGFQALDSQKPNPHILEGALVGGPDFNDKYSDERKKFKNTEVTLDHNSCFQVYVGLLDYYIWVFFLIYNSLKTFRVLLLPSIGDIYMAPIGQSIEVPKIGLWSPQPRHDKSLAPHHLHQLLQVAASSLFIY